MKNTFGQNVTITLFGESHGAAVGAVLDGIAAGLPADETFLAQRLTLRRPQLASDTARKEKDDFRILSGVKDGFTTGAPLTVIVPNEDIRSGDYEQIRNLPRPSHADYAARIKYGGYEDYRGGNRPVRFYFGAIRNQRACGQKFPLLNESKLLQEVRQWNTA